MRLLPGSQTPPREVAADKRGGGESAVCLGAQGLRKPKGKMQKKTGFKNNLKAGIATRTRLGERTQGLGCPVCGLRDTPGRAPLPTSGYLRSRART